MAKKTIGKLHLLSEALSEESKGSRLQIPMSMIPKITAFQEAFSERFDKWISRENVITLMMLHGSEGLKAEGEKLEKESKIPF